MDSTSFTPSKQGRARIDSAASFRLLKRGIWLYFLLLIFEGALRKWLLPGLATPLLIIRDPLALWLVFATWKKGLLPANPYLSGIFLIGIVSIVLALMVGHGNPIVAIYGAGGFLLHFPLIFLIGRVFNREDVVKICTATLFIAIPMIILIAIQFYSPQSAWVNRGVGGDTAGAGFGGALGFFRPPGTFSFTNGVTLFFGLTASIIFFFWLGANKINRLVLIAATAALMASIPFSMSRGLFFQVIVALLFVVIAVARKPKYVGKMLIATSLFVVAIALLSQTAFVQTAVEAFLYRFEDASDVEGGLKGTLVDRFLGGMVSALTQSIDMPFFGYGLGMGSNVGSMLLSGQRSFLIAEEEWGREIGELGPLLGLLLIALRTGFSIKISVACYRRLVDGDLLPWMLLSFGILLVLQGQWAQPTSLGFGTLVSGLLIASLRPFAPERQ